MSSPRPKGESEGESASRPEAQPHIIYIAEANRSDSTLLETLLARHARVASAGELFDLPSCRDGSRTPRRTAPVANP